jgi:hypothetical protein
VLLEDVGTETHYLVKHCPQLLDLRGLPLFVLAGDHDHLVHPDEVFSVAENRVLDTPLLDIVLP